MTLELEVKAPDDWEQKVAFARQRGLAQASFDSAGLLISFVLGPPPVEPGEPSDSDGESPPPRIKRHRSGIVEDPSADR